MNILELLAKNDPIVQVEEWKPALGQWQAHEVPRKLFSKVNRPRLRLQRWRISLGHQTVRGLVLKSGMRVIVRRAAKYWPEAARGEGVFTACSDTWTGARLIIGWSAGDPSVLEGALYSRIGSRLSSVAVPPVAGVATDLVIEVPKEKGAKLFLGVHRLLDRNDLYARCKGNGVEVGPGSKPQILPSARTRVKYVEQATPDRWQQLYGKNTKAPVDPSLWEHYVVGNADNIPAEIGSLDFIFSSHVVEHLANPLGHLAYWASLLKPGGVVAAVIPDRSGCKDYVFEPSTIEELVMEWNDGSMTPTLAHYQRWARHRVPSADPAEIMRSGRSIHVHFYTPLSMEAVLKRMHGEIGYRTYAVTWEPNHKDFFVLLVK